MKKIDLNGKTTGKLVKEWTEWNHDIVIDPFDPNIAYTIDDGEMFPNGAYGTTIMKVNFD